MGTANSNAKSQPTFASTHSVNMVSFLGAMIEANMDSMQQYIVSNAHIHSMRIFKCVFISQ